MLEMQRKCEEQAQELVRQLAANRELEREAREREAEIDRLKKEQEYSFAKAERHSSNKPENFPLEASSIMH